MTLPPCGCAPFVPITGSDWTELFCHLWCSCLCVADARPPPTSASHTLVIVPTAFQHSMIVRWSAQTSARRRNYVDLSVRFISSFWKSSAGTRCGACARRHWAASRVPRLGLWADGPSDGRQPAWQRAVETPEREKRARNTFLVLIEYCVGVGRCPQSVPALGVMVQADAAARIWLCAGRLRRV
jgi:hypothetical protein